MLFDIRLPIGFIFTIFGVIVSLYGLLSHQNIYDSHSLGININVWWGLVMFIFGTSFLIFAFRKKAKNE